MRMRVLSERSEAKDLSAFPQPRGILLYSGCQVWAAGC